MIDPAVRAILRSKFAVRRFFAFYGLALILSIVLLGAAHWNLYPGWLLDALSNFLTTISSALLLFILSYGFYVAITPPGLRNADIVPLRSGEISESILDLRADTADYWFWGRSGRYFRKEVLSRLNQISERERKHIRLRVVLPDFRIDANSQRYMHVLRGLDESATPHTLAANVVATAISVIVATAKNPYLTSEIALCPTVPVLRYDISNTGALITRDARHLPAILINSGNSYFEMLRDAVENELVQGAQLRWNNSAIAELNEPFDLGSELFGAIDGIDEPDSTAIEEARELLRKGAHRYV